MGANSKIAWCDHTFNPWARGDDGSRRKTAEGYWKKPLAWNQIARYLAGRLRVFAGSLCDVFEDWQGPIANHHGDTLMICDCGNRDGSVWETPPVTIDCSMECGRMMRRLTMADLRRDLFALIDATPNLDWLLATKRPENIGKMWECVPGRPYIPEAGAMNEYQLNRRENVHLLYSASDQETLEAGLPDLLACRDLVPVLGLSLGPLLGPIDLKTAFSSVVPASCCIGYQCGFRGLPCVDWVIVGGESGPKARPCALEWIDDIRRQCQEAGVPCFVKQDSGPAEWPEELRVEQFPK